MFERLGGLEIGLVLVVILIVFGAGKLPQVGGALGKSIREFRLASRGELDSSAKGAADKKAGNLSETQNLGARPEINVNGSK